MQAARILFEAEGRRPFQVRCDAGEVGQFCSGAQRASITVGQRILRDGAEEMWESVVVLCQEEEDGALAIRVVLCHPDWDEPREVARTRSWLGIQTPAGAAIECDLGVGRRD